MTEFWDELACVKIFWRASNWSLLKWLLSVFLKLQQQSYIFVWVCSLTVSRGDPNTYPLSFVCPVFWQCSHLGLSFLSWLELELPRTNQRWSFTAWWTKHQFSPTFFTSSFRKDFFDIWEGFCPQDTTTNFIKTLIQSQLEFKCSVFFENHLVSCCITGAIPIIRTETFQVAAISEWEH